MKCRGLPALLFSALAALTASTSCCGKRDLHCVELFAGSKCVAGNMMKLGLRCATFEKNDSPLQDILQAGGFLFAVQLVRRICKGGLLFMAPPCGSWVWVNRGTSCRTMWDPLGDVTKQSVRDANVIASRCMMLLLFAASREVQVIIEQPSSSLLHRHPRFGNVLAQQHRLALPVFRTHIFMSNFGGPTPKGTVLWSTGAWVRELASHGKANCARKKKLVLHYCDSKGRSRVRGTSVLKKSQAYPDGFGKALAALFLKHLHEPVSCKCPSAANAGKPTSDDWPDAELDELARMM